jgi:hypothetical protein
LENAHFSVQEETIQVKKKERKKKMLAVDVFTAVIDYFKMHLLREMKSPVLSNVDIQWVITVPAIWDLKDCIKGKPLLQRLGLTKMRFTANIGYV